MRIHLGLAALILIGGIVAGWWFERAPHRLKDPVEMRNAIASGEAVVVTFRPQGNSAGPAATITFIRDKGWMWEQPPSDNNAGGLVISTSSQTLAAAAPGCYIAIQDMNPPIVPGVNLASDLGHAPGLKVAGDIYTYQIGADDSNGEGNLAVSEDLSNVTRTQSYVAQLHLEGHGEGPPGATAEPGTYTIRRATDPERQAARRLLSEATASPVAAFAVEQRAVGPDQPLQVSVIKMVSPKACPGAVVLDPTVMGESPAVSVFTKSNPRAILGAAIETTGGRVAAAGVLPLDVPITAPANDLLAALLSATPQNLVLTRGATFGLAPATGPTWAVMAISACQPEPWFPC